MHDTLHPAMPEFIPDRIKRLPVDHRGFPVPWFVKWFDGKPDFRVTDADKLFRSFRDRLCWVCGESLGANMAFVIGPMCAINRTSGETPAHRDCAIFSAQACPFLTKPAVVRREDGLPDDVRMSSTSITRNPGAACVWITRSYKSFRGAALPEGGNEVLFHLGDPEEVLWFVKGVPAMRVDVLASINSGIHELRVACDMDPSDSKSAHAELTERVNFVVDRLLPRL